MKKICAVRVLNWNLRLLLILSDACCGKYIGIAARDVWGFVVKYLVQKVFKRKFLQNPQKEKDFGSKV